MTKKIGYPQYLKFLTYLDCKKRTMKHLDFKKDDDNDEKLIYDVLYHSSITQHDTLHSYSKVYDAVDLICKNLCPGEWCTRFHCKEYSSCSAWSCRKTRPAICKIYKKYIEKQKSKENGK